jgi:hypothetical protein
MVNGVIKLLAHIFVNFSYHNEIFSLVHICEEI